METKQKVVGVRISPDLYWAFKKRCLELSIEQGRNISLREAFEEALENWIKKHQVTKQSELMRLNNIEADHAR